MRTILTVILLSAATTTWSCVALARTANRQDGGWARAYDHIFVIIEENEESSSIIGNIESAPTMYNLAQRYGQATNYFGVIHPSEGNYVALLDANAHGVTDDNSYATHQFNNPTLVDGLEGAGLTWKGYFQSLPEPGFLGTCSPGPGSDCLYASKHNGFLNFSQILANPAELQKLVPDTVLNNDLTTDSVPNYSFIVPDQCHDMHGLGPTCPDGRTNIRVADEYLRTTVDAITSSRTWQEGSNAIVITFDEGSTTAGCCEANPGGGQVVTIVVRNRQDAPIQDATPFNHYSLVATIEKAFSVPCTQKACDVANVPTMDKLFDLRPREAS
jgi:hypothetical protein